MCLRYWELRMRGVHASKNPITEFKEWLWQTYSHNQQMALLQEADNDVETLARKKPRTHFQEDHQGFKNLKQACLPNFYFIRNHIALYTCIFHTYIAEFQRFKGLEYMLCFAVHTANSCARPNKNNEVKYWFAKPYLFCHLFIFPLPHWNLNASINHAKIQHIDLDIPIAIYSCRLVLNSSCCP